MFRFSLSTTAECTLAADLLALYQSREGCDLRLVIPGLRGGTLEAHACIVAARSPVLRQRIHAALLAARNSRGKRAATEVTETKGQRGPSPTETTDTQGDHGQDPTETTEIQGDRGQSLTGKDANMTEDASDAASHSVKDGLHLELQVSLPEAPSAAAVAALLYFCYSDELSIEHINPVLTPAELPRLLDICDCAGLYGVQRLKLLCTQAVRQAASADTVLDMLQVRRESGRDRTHEREERETEGEIDRYVKVERKRAVEIET